MRRLFAGLIALLLILPADAVFAKKCTGSAYCTACSNCSRCKYCNAGGTCGVCAGGAAEYDDPVMPENDDPEPIPDPDYNIPQEATPVSTAAPSSPQRLYEQPAATPVAAKVAAKDEGSAGPFPFFAIALIIALIVLVAKRNQKKRWEQQLRNTFGNRRINKH